MRRGFAYLVAAVAGVAAGAALGFAFSGDAPPPAATVPSAVLAGDLPIPTTRPGLPVPTSRPHPPSRPPETSLVPASPAPTPPPTTTSVAPVATDQVLLVWTPGRLPDGFAAEVAALPGVIATTVVRGDQAELVAWADAAGTEVGRAPDGFAFPVEVGAFEPATYGRFVAPEVGALLAALEPGQALLGETSARLRELGPGGALELAGGTLLDVVGVVDDVAIGGVEVAVRAGDPPGVDPERYLLVRYDTDRVALEGRIRALLPAGASARLRGPGETPVFRHGDAVLPQAQIKERFGEWAYRATSEGFEQEPGWVAEHIVTAELPILGTVRCHRNLVPALAGALAELEQRNLAFLVDPEGFRGCWNPRFIAGRRDPSRHAWGAAVDLNFGTSATGLESAQDPRLLEVMERWGFTSGHDWLIPDPGHFEYVRPPG